MTVTELQAELRRRGVLGLHVSLVGLGLVTITAVTETTDEVVKAPDLETAFRRLLARLEVIGHA